MKNVLFYLMASVCLFLTPIQGLLLSVAAAIFLDTIFGIYRSVKVKGWKFVTSRRLSEIISKMLLYQLCVISLYVMDRFLLNEFFSAWYSIPFLCTKICTIILVFIELVSIKENFEKATGLNIWVLLKTVLGRAKEVKDGVNDIID